MTFTGVSAMSASFKIVSVMVEVVLVERGEADWKINEFLNSKPLASMTGFQQPPINRREKEIQLRSVHLPLDTRCDYGMGQQTDIFSPFNSIPKCLCYCCWLYERLNLPQFIQQRQSPYRARTFL